MLSYEIELTPEEYREKKRLGMTDVEIRKDLFISKPAFIRWKQSHGIVTKKVMPKPKEIGLTPEVYRQMKLNRMSDEEIAEEYGISTATLSRWKQRNEVKAAKEPQDYLELKEQGYRDYQISRQWGVTPSALYTWKKRRGII